MTCSKGTVLVLGFPVCTLGFSLSPKIILDIASQTWCHYLKRINKSGLKSVGPTSVCPVMVPGLLYSMAAVPRQCGALDSASLGMGGWAPLAAIFFPPEVSESFDKEVVVVFYLPDFTCRALSGFGVHVAAVILLKQLHWNSLKWFSPQNVSNKYSVKPFWMASVLWAGYRTASVLVCIRNSLHKIVLVTI